MLPLYNITSPSNVVLRCVISLLLNIVALTAAMISKLLLVRQRLLNSPGPIPTAFSFFPSTPGSRQNAAGNEHRLRASPPLSRLTARYTGI